MVVHMTHLLDVSQGWPDLEQVGTRDSLDHEGIKRLTVSAKAG